MIWYSVNVGTEPQAESRSGLSFLPSSEVNYVSGTVHCSHELALILGQGGITLAFLSIILLILILSFSTHPQINGV